MANQHSLSILVFAILISSSFCLITFPRAAGHFGVCDSDTIEPTMIVVRLAQLPDPPDAHCFLMGLPISLVE